MPKTHPRALGLAWPRIILLVGLALALCGQAEAALFETEGRDIRAEIQAARDEGRRLVIFLELPDCPDCREMKRAVLADAQAMADFGRDYRTIRIDLASAAPLVDARGNASTPQAIAEEWRVFATPSFVFLAPDGSFEYRHTGALARPSDLLSLGRFVLRAIYETRPFASYLAAQGVLPSPASHASSVAH